MREARLNVLSAIGLLEWWTRDAREFKASLTAHHIFDTGLRKIDRANFP
jgi:hypothetical protein